MGKQNIIVISREFGSGGHEIAEKLSKYFNLPFYDRNLLDEIAKENQVNEEVLRKYDEAPRNRLLSRTVLGISNSPEQNVAELQFDLIRKKAKEGKSFIIVGRCAEHILKDYKGLIRIFVLGDWEAKVQRIMLIHDLTKQKAETMITNYDKKRRAYHNANCPVKWGDSRGYDLTINSSKLGINQTVDILKDYINMRMEM